MKYNNATTKYIIALTSLSKARWIAEQRTKAALRSDISDGEIEDAMFDCVQGRKDVASLLGDHGSRPAAGDAREGGGPESRQNPIWFWEASLARFWGQRRLQDFTSTQTPYKIASTT